MHFTHLSYGGCINLLQQAKGVPVDLWYFVVKTTPGVFKIVEPSLCRVLQSTTIKSPRAVFQYQSKKGNWLSTEHYSFKNNGYYFSNKSDAQAAFKTMVEGAKIHFKKQIVDAESALNILNNY